MTSPDVAPTLEENSPREKMLSIGKANLEAHRKRQKALKKRQLADLNRKAAHIGPEIMPKAIACEYLGISSDHFSRCVYNSDEYPFDFISVKPGKYYYNFPAFIKRNDGALTGEELRDYVFSFFKVAIENIEKTGSFSRGELTEGFEMASVNADFFITYATTHKLCYGDPRDINIFYWTGEEQGPAPVIEPPPKKTPKKTPKKVAEKAPKPRKLSCSWGERRTERLEELSNSLLALGAGFHRRLEICRPTSVSTASFQTHKLDIPFAIRAGSQRYYYDFSAMYHRAKITKTGAELAQLVDAFYKSAIAAIRNGHFSASLAKTFTEAAVTSKLALPPQQVEFLIWYLLTHELIEKRGAERYEWVAPDEIASIVDFVSPPCPAPVKDKPAEEPQVKEPRMDDPVEDSQIAFGLCASDRPSGIALNVPIFKGPDLQKSRFTKADLYGPQKPSPLKPTPISEAVMAAISKQPKPVLTVAAPTASALSKNILDAILDLTQLVEALPQFSTMPNSTGRVAELEEALAQIAAMAKQAEALLDAGKVTQGGAQILRIIQVATDCGRPAAHPEGQ